MDEIKEHEAHADGMSHYQKWEHAKLDDIDCDTDEILEILQEEKHMGEGFDMGMLAGMMGNKGIDPGIVALLNDKCRDGTWGEGGGMLVLLFLIILLGGGNGFGWGNNRDGGFSVDGVNRTVVNEANFGQLLDAINGNREAIERVASNCNCSVQQVQMALCGVDKQLALNHGDFINAIQSCCCNIRTDIMQSQNAIQSQLAKCCCDTNLNIERQGCQTRQDIQETRFLIQTTDAASRQLAQQQHCETLNAISGMESRLIQREDQREIQALRDKLEEAKAETRQAQLIAAISGTRNVRARYDTDNQTICGTVGACGCGCGNFGF